MGSRPTQREKNELNCVASRELHAGLSYVIEYVKKYVNYDVTRSWLFMFPKRCKRCCTMCTLDGRKVQKVQKMYTMMLLTVFMVIYVL